jgi:hypothetical protein
MSLRPLLISGGSNERQRVMMKRKKRAESDTHSHTQTLGGVGDTNRFSAVKIVQHE